MTPAEFAQTINPRRDAVLRSRTTPHRNPPLPPRIQQPKTAGANSKLDKTWGNVTPYEAIQELWKSKPEAFIIKLHHHLLGPKT